MNYLEKTLTLRQIALDRDINIINSAKTNYYVEQLVEKGYRKAEFEYGEVAILQKALDAVGHPYAPAPVEEEVA